MSTAETSVPDHTSWNDVIRRLVSKQQYELWFSSLQLVSADASGVNLCVVNPFIRDWLSTYYSEVLRTAARECLGVDAPVRVTLSGKVDADTGASVGSNDTAGTSAQNFAPILPVDLPSAHGAHAATPRAEPASPANAASRAYFAHHSDIVLNGRYGFDNFVTGPSNRLAYAAARSIADAPGASYNPLFLYGRVGLGKTHLLQAICHQVLASGKPLNVLYLSSETFVNQFIGAIENGDLERFRQKYRTVDMLLVDDIHLLAHKDRTQEEFFHTFNSLYNAGRQIVLSSDSPAAEIPTLKERLISRFKWGLEAALAPPGYETRLAILRRKARDRGVDVPEDVLTLLTEHVDTNIRELEGAITKVIGYAQLIHKDITLDVAQAAIGLAPSGPSRPVTGIDRVVDVVCKHFGVRMADMQGRKRTQSIAMPRQTAMYLARRLTTLSLEEIGGHLGGRDHSTVLYAVERTLERIKQDASFAQLVIDLENRAQR